MKHQRQSIGRDKAIALYESGWWLDKTPKEIATFQLFTDELCMPFDNFHEALETCLSRPVFTHELALNWDGLASELLGEFAAPSLEDIVNLLPADKTHIVVI